MIEYLKKGTDREKSDEADRKVRQTVEAILGDITERGDEAVRELSEKFDKWSPESFRLSQDEIDALIDSLPEQVLSDIDFAQTQIRNFAQAQLASMKAIE